MEEKKLIDGNKLIAYFKEQCDVAIKDSEKESIYVLAALECCIDLFENFPSVNAVEVVRCKDCKYGNMCSIREAMACTVPDGYCWRGEKRGD